jgi:hypothetical protein
MPTPPRRTTKTSSHFGLRRDLLDAVGILLTQARSVLFITGPGLSSDSGLTNYRGLPGLLKRKPDDAHNFEAALSSEMLARKPQIAWRYLLQMESQVSAAKPSRGHEVLVELERALPRTTIMTINVDRLHQRAGSHNVIEMHGALHDLLCTRCEISHRYDDFDAIDIPPTCGTCGRRCGPTLPLSEPPPPDVHPPRPSLRSVRDGAPDRRGRYVRASPAGAARRWWGSPLWRSATCDRVLDVDFGLSPLGASDQIWAVFPSCPRGRRSTPACSTGGRNDIRGHEISGFKMSNLAPPTRPCAFAAEKMPRNYSTSGTEIVGKNGAVVERV